MFTIHWEEVVYFLGTIIQSIEITRNSIPDFLVNTLNDLERILSNHYGEKICASIKLCNTQNTLKTFARGQNNVTCRGGIKKVRIQNTKPIKIGDNYAYDTILKRKFQYFAEGDLTNLSEKEKDDDKFFCEYGDKWKSLFRSMLSPDHFVRKQPSYSVWQPS